MSHLTWLPLMPSACCQRVGHWGLPLKAIANPPPACVPPLPVHPLPVAIGFATQDHSEHTLPVIHAHALNENDLPAAQISRPSKGDQMVKSKPERKQVSALFKSPSNSLIVINGHSLVPHS